MADQRLFGRMMQNMQTDETGKPPLQTIFSIGFRYCHAMSYFINEKDIRRGCGERYFFKADKNPMNEQTRRAFLRAGLIASAGAVRFTGAKLIRPLGAVDEMGFLANRPRTKFSYENES